MASFKSFGQLGFLLGVANLIISNSAFWIAVIGSWRREARRILRTAQMSRQSFSGLPEYSVRLGLVRSAYAAFWMLRAKIAHLDPRGGSNLRVGEPLKGKIATSNSSVKARLLICQVVVDSNNRLQGRWIVSEHNTQIARDFEGQTSFEASDSLEFFTSVVSTAEKEKATEIVITCAHVRLAGSAIASAVQILQTYPQALIAFCPRAEKEISDRWVIDVEGRLRNDLEDDSWWQHRSDRQTNIAVGLPIAIRTELLTRVIWSLERDGCLASNVGRISVATQMCGGAVFELRQSGISAHVGTLESCELLFPVKPIDFAARMRAWVPNFLEERGFNEGSGISIARFLSDLEQHSIGKVVGQGPVRVLYVSPFATHPTDHGNRRTMVNFGRVLQLGGARTVFASSMDPDTTPRDLVEMRSFWGDVERLPVSPRPLGHYGAPFDSWVTDSTCAAVRKLCLEYQIDVVICSYVWLSRVLEYVPAHVKRILDTHDRFADRFALFEERGLKKSFFSCSESDEAEYLARAEVVIARQREEAEFFQTLCPRADVRLVNHFEFPSPVPPKERGSLMVFGLAASSNSVNQDAVNALLEALLEENRCDFQLTIVGTVSDTCNQELIREVERRHPGVLEVQGFLKNIDTFYQNVHCVVAPISFGTGVNVKVLEAMSKGLPLLSTRFGSRGTGSRIPEHNLSSIEDLLRTMKTLSWSRLDQLADESLELGHQIWQLHSGELLEILGMDSRPAPNKVEWMD